MGRKKAFHSLIEIVLDKKVALRWGTGRNWKGAKSSRGYVHMMGRRGGELPGRANIRGVWVLHLLDRIEILRLCWNLPINQWMDFWRISVRY